VLIDKNDVLIFKIHLRFGILFPSAEVGTGYSWEENSDSSQFSGWK
jgi:hypothetical protein